MSTSQPVRHLRAVPDFEEAPERKVVRVSSMPHQKNRPLPMSRAAETPPRQQSPEHHRKWLPKTAEARARRRRRLPALAAALAVTGVLANSAIRVATMDTIGSDEDKATEAPKFKDLRENPNFYYSPEDGKWYYHVQPGDEQPDIEEQIFKGEIQPGVREAFEAGIEDLQAGTAIPIDIPGVKVPEPEVDLHG